MDISCDYRDLLSALNKHRAKYLVTGAYAVTFYTEPRFTKDLDIWVKADPGNAKRLQEALLEFGAPLKNISKEDFCDKKIIYQIGVAPIRIDIMMGIPGLEFDRAWKNRKRTTYAGVPINILGIRDLIRSKRKAGREQDILDLKKLSRKLRTMSGGRKA